MQSDQYKRDMAALVESASKPRDDISKQEKIAGDARIEAGRKRIAALKATSASTREMHLRSAKTQDDKVAAAEKEIGELQGKLGSNADSRLSKEKSLRTALSNEQSAADRVAEQRRRRQKAEQDASDRAAVKRREIERNHARDLGRLASSTVHHVMVPAPEPKKLRVLYLTASPPRRGAFRFGATPRSTTCSGRCGVPDIVTRSNCRCDRRRRSRIS